MMKTIRRWAASVIASVDSVVSQIENHDALVASTIREVQNAAARAKVQLGKVRQDGKQLRLRIVELSEQEEMWQERARSTAEESKALECVKRARKLSLQRAALEAREREHSQTERQLVSDLQRIDERIRMLREQRNLLRSRQSRAEALAASRETDSTALVEIDDIFERWETKVTEYEIQGECDLSSVDPLDDEFVEKEEEAELRAELERLKGRSTTAA